MSIFEWPHKTGFTVYSSFKLLSAGATSQRSQASVPDSGYGSNSSFNTTGSRSMSTQATQRSISDMFSPNSIRVTSQSTNSNTQKNQTNPQNSFNNSTNSRTMNGYSSSSNTRGTPTGRGNSRPPLAVVTGNTVNSGNRNSGSWTSGNAGNNYNQSRNVNVGNSSGNNFNQSRNVNVGNSSGNNFNQSRNVNLPNAGGDAGNGDEANEIVCNCGNDALLLTVRKEGPNTGKQYMFFIKNSRSALAQWLS